MFGRFSFNGFNKDIEVEMKVFIVTVSLLIHT